MYLFLGVDVCVVDEIYILSLQTTNLQLAKVTFHVKVVVGGYILSLLTIMFSKIDGLNFHFIIG